MSNILIIKHGALGDISQISGALRDIKETYKDKKIFILTTLPYVELLSKCPYLDGVLIDKRLPRWNIFYLVKLKKMISKFDFSYVFDLQNSSRTSFYRKFLLNITNWSSTETTLKKEKNKENYKNESVLDRFKIQLELSNVKTNHTLKPDFSWAIANVDQMVNKYFGKKFILVFPFCSPQLPHKKWPHFNELIKIIKNKHPNIEVAIAPGPKEINEASQVEAISITNKGRSLNHMELAGLINKSSYVISNDTGPAHMTAHLGKKGIVLFGHHTTPKKVSIETNNFRALTEERLENLTAERVYLKIKDKLESIY